MKILIGMGHPKDVHLWKNIIRDLLNDGHEVKIVAWDKDVTLYLLDAYGFPYEVLGKSHGHLVGKVWGLLKSELISFKIARRFAPDILVGRESCLAHVSKLIGKPYIVFEDTEHATISNWLKFPFSDVICTPSCFTKAIAPEKHITFNGYQELAYLHPNCFKPDPSILEDLGLSRGDRYIIVRFVSWGASHDVGHHGFAHKEEVIRSLERYGQVLISSEQKLDKNFEKYQITLPPEKMHDLLYYANLYIGEGATMACESAVLGTPAIYINTQKLGYLDDIEKRYELVYNFSDPKNGEEQAFGKAIELLERGNLKKEWQTKREKMLNEKIDVAAWMTHFIENYLGKS